MSRRLPRYALAGAVITAVSEAAMLMRIEPFWSWHTPIAWTGYILFIDGLVWKRRGSSWLTTARPEFAFLALVSIPLWLVFEFYNLFIDNWHYVNLPEPLPLRLLGYAWSFATIWPAIFETGDLIATRNVKRETRNENLHLPRSFRVPRSAFRVTELLSILIGAAMLIAPLVMPSQYFAAPVWLGFIFLLDPINARFGGESLMADLRRRDWDRAINLGMSGLVCGILWEFWNYWSRAKWIYTVPIFPDWRVFEMPVLGYGGFPAFALECLTMYVTVRLALWRGRTRPISL